MKIQRKNDDTFIVEFNGLPFHITPDYPTSELYGIEMTHAVINEYVVTHPEDVMDYVEPEVEIPEISEEQQKQMAIVELEKEAQRLIPAIQAGIDAEFNQQSLVSIMLEIEELKGNI